MFGIVSWQFNIKSIQSLSVRKEKSINLFHRFFKITVWRSAVKNVVRFRVGHIRLVVLQSCVQPGVHAAQDQIEPGEGELRGSPVLRVGFRSLLLLLLLRSLLPAATWNGIGSHMCRDAACVQNISCNQQVIYKLLERFVLF